MKRWLVTLLCSALVVASCNSSGPRTHFCAPGYEQVSSTTNEYTCGRVKGWENFPRRVTCDFGYKPGPYKRGQKDYTCKRTKPESTRHSGPTVTALDSQYSVAY